MKRDYFLLVVLCIIGLRAFSQMNIRIVDLDAIMSKKPIDHTVLNVQYEMSWVNDTSNPGEHSAETMMLKVGDKSSVFYSYGKFMADSVLEADKAAGVPVEVINEHMQQYMGKVNYEIYKNYPAGKVTTLDEVSVSRLKCEETNEMPVWQILDDTLEVLSYLCRKAVCSFKGREYEAWYTEEIPRSEGPWKLSGLPGLILKAEDSKGEYRFICTGIEKARAEDPILYSDTNFEPVSRKEYDKIYARFMYDPLGYIAQMAPHVKVTVKNESGEATKPMNMPYNPIEIR